MVAIVVDLQLGRSLAAVGPHNAVVELLDETTRGARDPVILPIISARRARLPAHVDSAALSTKLSSSVEGSLGTGATVKPSKTDQRSTSLRGCATGVGRLARGVKLLVHGVSCGPPGVNLFYVYCFVLFDFIFLATASLTSSGVRTQGGEARNRSAKDQLQVIGKQRAVITVITAVITGL